MSFWPIKSLPSGVAWALHSWRKQPINLVFYGPATWLISMFALEACRSTGKDSLAMFLPGLFIAFGTSCFILLALRPRPANPKLWERILAVALLLIITTLPVVFSKNAAAAGPLISLLSLYFTQFGTFWIFAILTNSMGYFMALSCGEFAARRTEIRGSKTNHRIRGIFAPLTISILFVLMVSTVFAGAFLPAACPMLLGLIHIHLVDWVCRTYRQSLAPAVSESPV